MTVFYVLSMFDPNFLLIVAKPDNVPITFVLFLVAFFTWFAMYQGVENDKRIAKGEPVLEKQEQDKVWVWPDLVYTELLCMVILGDRAHGVVDPAPGAARTARQPGGLAEPLEGAVVLPRAAGDARLLRPLARGRRLPDAHHRRPHGDSLHRHQPQGERLLHVQGAQASRLRIFLFGFLVLWVLLVVSGTFLRGPNWNFFGPYEYWDPHRVEPLLNVNVSDFFWVRATGTAPALEPLLARVHWRHRSLCSTSGRCPSFWRGPKTSFPAFLRWASLHDYYERMGPTRYYIGIVLFLLMLSLPIKMYLRWAFNLKYIVAFPEIFFNI